MKDISLIIAKIYVVSARQMGYDGLKAL